MSKLEIANYIIENKKIPQEFNDYVIVQISDLHNINPLVKITFI